MKNDKYIQLQRAIERRLSNCCFTKFTFQADITIIKVFEKGVALNTGYVEPIWC